MVDDPRIEPMELARPPIYALERANSEYSAGRKTIEVIPTRVKADSFQGFQNGASSESCPSASATGPMHDAQCGLVLSVVCRAGGDRDLARATAWGARDRPPAQARAVHDLA